MDWSVRCIYGPNSVNAPMHTCYAISTVAHSILEKINVKQLQTSEADQIVRSWYYVHDHVAP